MDNIYKHHQEKMNEAEEMYPESDKKQALSESAKSSCQLVIERVLLRGMFLMYVWVIILESLSIAKFL